MKILVDTSVWIDYFRGKENVQTALFGHIEQGRVCTLGCIFAELLQGAGSVKESDVLLSYFESLPRLEENGSLWIEAGKLSNQKKLISKGIGIIDAVLMISAKKQGCQIWTLDKKILKELDREHIFHPR